MTEQTATQPVGETVRAEHVEISQGGVNIVEAGTVSITQGGAGQVRADQVTISQGGVGLARTRRLTIGGGAAALAVVADEVHAESGANVFMLLAGSASGEVRPLLDVRAALAIGGGFAAVAWLLRRLF